MIIGFFVDGIEVKLKVDAAEGVAVAMRVKPPPAAAVAHFKPVEVEESATSVWLLVPTGRRSLVVEKVYMSPLVVKGEVLSAASAAKNSAGALCRHLCEAGIL